MKKRILSFLLAFVMLVGMLPVQVFATAIPSGAPFSAITTDAGDAGTVTLQGTTSFSSGYNSFNGVPHYHVQIPQGTTKVFVTYPKNTYVFADEGYNAAYGYWAKTSDWTGGSATFSFTATEDGYTIEIPLTYSVPIKDESWNTVGTEECNFVGTNATHAIAVEKNGELDGSWQYDPLCFFTFEYEAEAEPTPPAATPVAIPNGSLNPAISISEAEETNFDMWGYGGSPANKYTVSLPAGTETVTITYDATASIYFNTYTNDGTMYFAPAVYDESTGTYVGYNSGSWENVVYAETDGVYSIQLDVKSLIEGGRLYGHLNEDMSVPYLLEFEYSAGSSSGHECIWNSGKVTKEPTCQEFGERTYECTISGCDKTKTEEIKKKDHSWDDGTVTKEPTCQTDGERTKKCTYNCGTTTKETIAASAEYHKWNTGEVTKEPTCKDKGVKTYTCTVDDCGKTKTEDIPLSTDHSYGDDGNAETCTVCNAANPNYVDPNLPQQVDGVYQIGTAEQLLSFAKFVNKGNTNLSAVLTADINLTGKKWTPMSSSNAAFNFDGQGHTITFDNAENGLFAVLRGQWKSGQEYTITKYATVSNVIIEGTINGAGNVGAVAGEAYGVKITGCINYAKVNGSGNNVGGILGYAYRKVAGINHSNVILTDCGNMENVQGASYVGGIVGCTYSYGELYRCVNTGSVTGTGSYVGGLAGLFYETQKSRDCVVENSYNWGAISGSSLVGGLFGQLQNQAEVKNCYNVGSASNAFAGKVQYSNSNVQPTISNFYYLDSATSSHGTAMTAEAMTSADFVATLNTNCGNNYFRATNTYPALLWLAAGNAKQYAVVAPTIAGINFTGTESAYDNEDYTFTIALKERYRITDSFAILVNGKDYTVQPNADGVYECVVPKAQITQDLQIVVQGVEATKTVLYTGNSAPETWAHVAEIAVDDVNVVDGGVRKEGNTIYVTLDPDTDQDASVYFTVTTGGQATTMLSVTPGTSFTRQLNAGGLTQDIAASVANSGSISWTIVVTVDGIVSHKVNLPTGEGYQVYGKTAVVDGQDYNFSIAVDSKYSSAGMVVKAGGKTLNPNEDGSFTVKNVTEDVTITVEGITKKPFEDPFVSIQVNGETLDAEKIQRKTEDFHLGGKGESFAYRVYTDVPYYHVSVPAGTEWVEVIFKAVTQILVDSDNSSSARGYETDVDGVDAVASATIRGKQFEYTENSDGTKTVKIPVEGYTVTQSGGKAIGPEEPETNQNWPVALFSFIYDELFQMILPEDDTFTVIPQNGYSTSVHYGDEFAFTVRTKPGYVKGDNFTVTVNEVPLVPDSNGVYTITNVTENQSIAVTGVEKKDSVTAYLSISEDAGFMVGANTGAVMALQKLEVPWFDLSAYGLEAYAIPNTKEDYREPTVLHLYIYATEVLYCGVPKAEAGQGYLYENDLMDSLLKIDYSQGGGSLYFKGFWNKDENLNYYVNYEFPKYANGVGATADWLTLKNGDVVTVGHFSDEKFKDDPDLGFNYIKVGDSKVNVSAKQNDEITFTVWHAGADVSVGNTAHSIVNKQLDVYYAHRSTTEGDVKGWQKLGTTDATGKLTTKISLDAGEYVVAVAGRNGTNLTSTVVSAPGAILLTVLEDEASKQVNAVIKQIDEIGEVTLEKESAIDAAWTAYQNLSEEQQSAVTNIDKLTKAKETLAALKKAKEDQEKADAFAAKVDAIGTVEATDDCKSKIDIAKATYELLSVDQRELAKEAKAKLDKAEADYAKLVADEKDKLAADAVEAKISAIGEISLSSEALIQAARAAYNELTDVQKLLVENYVILQAAEKKLAEQKDEAAADAVEAKITAIGTVTLDSEAAIKAAREAYAALTDAQKALVANITVLEAAEEALELLKLAGTDLTKMYQKTGSYLAGLSAPGVGSTNGEWRVIGLARAGKTVADSYYNAAVKFVKENMDENGRLHISKSTENSRLIVALTAIGKDVTDVDGYNLLTGLNDMTYIGKQGFNGTIWALIALDTHDYEIQAGDVTREKLVQTILGKQCSDGGWSLSGIAGDPDITGMTLQALAPYYSSNSGVKAAVDKALGWLSGIQAKDGTFSCSEGVTSESLAQVITGLTALGINPETDSRFVKNGVSAMDALSKFYLGDGTFEHGLGNGRNMMATEQAYYALVSYFRLLQGKTSLYDMSDVTIVVPVYKIIDGANSDWQRDDAALTIRADGAFSKFTGVKVDGVTVDKKHYIAKEGSTVITFTEEYLKTLSEGDHTITVSFTDGEASTTVTVLPSDEEAAKRVMDLIAAIGTVTENSGDKIKAAQNAYDSLTEDQKKLVTSYKTLTDAESAYDSLVSKISVSFTLLGCSSHGEGTVHTYAGGNLGTWIGTKTYKVEAGATVKDVLEKALKDAGMSHRNPTGNYVESINGIGEFTNGSNSGWMYTLNGYYPNQGVAEQTVKDGDVIVFHYTDDYTKERAGQAFADRDEAAADAVEKLIDAIGTVTLNSKDKIEAARKAYDALTYTQKQKVENEKKLTDAETKYNELKKADDEKKADAVEKQIDQLNSHSATYEKDVKAAKAAYDGLTSEQKKLVGNYAKLAAALKELAEEEDKEAAEKVEKLIKQIGTVTKDSEAKIKAAREAYDKLNDEQKALVENLAVLEAAEEKLAELKALETVEEIYKTTGNYLEALGTPAPGSVGGEWMVIGLIRSGRSFKTADGYYDAVIKFVQENIDENGRLHNAKSTENSRIILALTAMGKDVTNVDGHNLLTGLKDMEYVRKQGINGPIWALIALDSGNYPAPGGDVTSESLIQVILDAQLADGGWALSGTVSDPDMTGMALQALAPYCKTNADVKKAAEEALVALSKMQAADGSYAGIDGTSSESVAQVIVALSALGIDANTDSRFVKNGISALDALCAFFVEGGGFKHIPDGKLDGMATEQSYYALAAYFRMLEGKTNLFDMTDVMDLGGDTVGEEPAETLPAETEPALTETVETTVEEGRSFPWWLVVVIVVLAGSIVALVIVSKSKKHKYVR